jgi:hypothetical protein
MNEVEIVCAAGRNMMGEIGDSIYQNNLGKCVEGVIVHKMEGYTNISKALNDGLDKVKTPYALCVQQDIILPKSWLQDFLNAVKLVPDNNWLVMGTFGITLEGKYCIYTKDRGKEIGHHFEGLKEVRSLDEVIIFMNMANRIKFDETFDRHLYGTTIVLDGWSKGLKSYAFSCYVEHNTSTTFPLDKGFVELLKKFLIKYRVLLNQRSFGSPIFNIAKQGSRFVVSICGYEQRTWGFNQGQLIEVEYKKLLGYGRNNSVMWKELINP